MIEYYKSLLCDDLRCLYDILYQKYRNAESRFKIEVNTSANEINNIISDISAVSLMISYDHPELLHLDLGKGVEVSVGSDGYNTYAEVRCNFDRRAINCKVPRINVRGRSQRERAYDILNTLIHSIDYDLRYGCQSAFSAIYNKRAVCSGYSALYKIYLDRENIECVMVSGIGRNDAGSQKHSWVRCVLDGRTYYIDPTWCDPMIDGVQHHVIDDRYFGFNPKDGSHIEQYANADHFMGRAYRNGWYSFNKSNKNVNTNYNNSQNKTRNDNVQDYRRYDDNRNKVTNQNNRTNNNNVRYNQNTRPNNHNTGSSDTRNDNDGGLLSYLFSGGLIAVCIKLGFVYFIGKNIIQLGLHVVKGVPNYVVNLFRHNPSLKWIVIAVIVIFLISKSKNKK